MDAPTSKAPIRTRIACEECRKNKRKCDGQKPNCSLCKKLGKVCIFASELSRKRKYVDEDLVKRLETQITSLKYEVMQYRRLEASREFPGGSGLAAKTILDDTPLEDPSCQADQLRSHPPDPIDTRSQVAMEDLASLMLTMDIEDRGEPSFMISSAKSKPFKPDGQELRKNTYGLSTNLEPIGYQAINAQVAMRQRLLDTFIRDFNGFHQYLEQNDSIYSALEEPRQGEIDMQFRNNSLLAVGAYLTDIPEAPNLGSEYAEYAESIVLRCMREKPSDLVAQGLSLLAWRELVLGNDSMAYNYIAMTTGLILHLGLHVSASRRTTDAADVNENPGFRRRVRSFWAYFSVDRLITSSLGMNCTMHWQRIKSPTFLSILEGEPSVDEAAHDQFCQLWHLWDSCMDQFYAFGWSDLSSDERKRLVTRSHDALEEFYRKIDERLMLSNNGGMSSASVIWFNMAYHAAVLLIHRPFLNEPEGSFALNFALRSATSAASSITHIIRSYSKCGNFSLAAPQIVDYIFSAAVIHLLNATSGRTPLGRQSAIGLKTCLTALLEMEPKWKSRVQLSIKKIQELAHKWKVVWALPLQVSQPIDHLNYTPEAAVTIHNDVDLFDCTQDAITDYSFDAMGMWDANQYEAALAQVHVPVELQESWNLDFLFDEGGNFVNS